MRLYEFQVITEDYTSSAKRLIAQGADPAEVEAAFSFHKQWKNLFKPEWKDIDKVNDWAGFKQFIDKERIDRDIKDEAKQHDQVVLRDDAEWFIVVPLKHSTSCFHGSNTDWCTTKVTQDNFSHYFFKANITLIYCIKHADPNKPKWAVALHEDHLKKSEFFDIRDASLKQDQFEAQTGLKFQDLVAGVKANLNHIKDKREINKKKDLFYLLNDAIDTGKRNTYLERLIIINKNFNAAYKYAFNVIKGRWPEGEPAIAKDSNTAWDYAWNIIKGRWPEGEPAIAKDSKNALLYASKIIKKRWLEAEPIFLEKPSTAYDYAKKVIKGRWPEGEPIIAKNASVAYNYARNIIKGRWPEAEPRIATKAKSSYNYAVAVIKGRWPKGEPEIAKTPEVAINYTRYVIKGRWPEAEPYFAKAKSPYYSQDYAREVLKDPDPKTWAERYLAKHNK